MSRILVRDFPGYNAAHMAVRRARGPAKDQVCTCGAQAADWAYTGEGTHGAPEQYVALCRPCHRIHDGGVGETHYGAKVTEEQVHAIRDRHAAGEHQRALAREFGISQTSVSHMVRRVTWKHI